MEKKDIYQKIAHNKNKAWELVILVEKKAILLEIVRINKKVKEEDIPKEKEEDLIII